MELGGTAPYAASSVRVYRAYVVSTDFLDSGIFTATQTQLAENKQYGLSILPTRKD